MNQNRGTFVELILMKFSLSLALLTAFFISSCADVEEPPPGARYRASNVPPKREQYPPQQQPFNPNAPPPENTAAEATSASPAPPAARAKVAKGDFPYGIPVPGKPHVVESPLSPGKQVDVEGFAPGTAGKDPCRGRI